MILPHGAAQSFSSFFLATIEHQKGEGGYVPAISMPPSDCNPIPQLIGDMSVKVTISNTVDK